MPRNISFFHTQDKIKGQDKTVTRRLGWRFLKAGDTLNACEKCQGLGKGEKINVLCQIMVVSVRREPLNTITLGDVIAEGFPDMTVAQFVEFFCETMICEPGDNVTRIEFRYLASKEAMP